MAEVTITINGRHYDIACDEGQEGRIIDLAGYIDEHISSVARTGAAYNDSHLQILTLLVVADELFEAREGNVSSEVGPDIAALKDDLRAEIQAEMAQNNDEKQSSPPEFEDTEEGQATIKVLQHLNERVNSLAARVEAL